MSLSIAVEQNGLQLLSKVETLVIMQLSKSCTETGNHFCKVTEKRIDKHVNESNVHVLELT